MKQIVQNARSGDLQLAEVPPPAIGPGQILVQNHYSVVSPGTDKLAMSFARKSLLAKARSRPDLVEQVIRKVRQEGPMPTYRSAMNKLDAPQPLGYSSAGVVLAVADDVHRFVPGDRVACAGAGYANHAEIIVVPENLVALVPEPVGLDQAAFATLGAIALQGVRIAEPGLGEVVAVIGLGLIGQLTVQLLVANGCRVLGVDLDKNRIQEAVQQGAEWGASPEELKEGWSAEATEGLGVDFSVVTASANDSAPIALSASLCRHGGRVVVVGAMPLELDRRTFYEKELSLRLSMSYGPGRYDRNYEELGLDYPLPFVRWTENRNLQAFLALVAAQRIHPAQLDTVTVEFPQAVSAYEGLARGTQRSLAVVFQYGETPDLSRTQRMSETTRQGTGDRVGVGFLGAGNYAKAVLLPALAEMKSADPITLVTGTGPSGQRTAERFSFAQFGTDARTVLEDEQIDLVFITTRHNLHAQQAIDALEAGKAVWLEKPVGLRWEHVRAVEQAVRAKEGFLMVGYNRRFSSHARAIRDAFKNRQAPMTIQYTVAAGPPPRDTWITDLKEGGGRVLGECCHFVDLCTYLVGRLPHRVFATHSGLNTEIDDSTTIVMSWPDGSTATIHYLARAASELPKERFEVSCGQVTATCDNFRQTKIHGSSGGIRKLNHDKGQATALTETLAAIRKGAPSPISIEEILSVSETTFAILESQQSGQAISIGNKP
ncbi:bi-domain-containing oxidoreductase [Myxococcota bacterium]|nr:bi-domain-containing oxidoreductase [Myxococcota bacterium]